MPKVALNENDGLIEFLKITGRLKKEVRRGWVIQAGVPNPESVADHTFRLILLVMVIGDLRGLSTEKMMRLAMIHDLGESLVGDITPMDKDRETKRIEENEAIKKLFSILPDKLRDEYLRLWDELCSGSSLEAILVKDADKLEMALQATEYMGEGYSKEMLSKFKVSAIQGMKDDKMLDLMRSI